MSSKLASRLCMVMYNWANRATSLCKTEMVFRQFGLVVIKGIANCCSSVLDNSIEKARILGLSKRLQVDYGVGYHTIAEGQGIQ